MTVICVHISEEGKISFSNNNYELKIIPNKEMYYGPSKNYVISIGPKFVSSRKRKIEPNIEFELSPEQIRQMANEILHMDIMRKIKRDNNAVKN